MIHFLVTADHDYTLTEFFGHWGSKLRQQVRIVHYESRPWGRVAPPGTWVFTDLERLTPVELAAAQSFFQRLETDRSRWRPLNNPTRALRRHDLLRALAARNINKFQAYSAAELPGTVRFPVFIRSESNHKGALSALLADRQSLERALEKLRAAGSHRDLLVVEYCPYDREDGLFVKRSVMRVTSELVPRHMLFSRQWEVKTPDHLDAACVAEEEEYVQQMPHGKELREIFDIAGIEYGRIDYTVVHGHIQVFEINTNPMLVPPVTALAPARWPSQARSAALMLQAMEGLNVGLPEPAGGEIRGMMRASLRQRFIRRMRRRWCKRRP
jgi:hypothetical protein